MFSSKSLYPAAFKVALSVGPVALLFALGWLSGIAGLVVYQSPEQGPVILAAALATGCVAVLLHRACLLSRPR